MVVRCQCDLRCILEFWHAVSRSLLCTRPWPRQSVALPLGINGHPQGVLLPASTLLFCLTLAAEACGAHCNVSCGPPRREASARATLKGRKSFVQTTALFCKVRPRRASPAPLMRRSRQGQRPKGRNCPTTNIAQCSQVRAAASGPGIEDAPPQARRVYEPQELSPTGHSKFTPLFHVRLRCTLLMINAVRRQRRAATSSDELQPSACRGGGLRDPKGRRSTARFSSIHNPNLLYSACRPSPRAAKPLGDEAGGSKNRATRSWPKARQTVQPHPPPKSKPYARPSAAGKPVAVFPPEKQAQPQAQPGSPPRASLTAAPLSLRRVFARLARFILFRLAAEIAESLL